MKRLILIVFIILLTACQPEQAEPIAATSTVVATMTTTSEPIAVATETATATSTPITATAFPTATAGSSTITAPPPATSTPRPTSTPEPPATDLTIIDERFYPHGLLYERNGETFQMLGDSDVTMLASNYGQVSPDGRYSLQEKWLKDWRTGSEIEVYPYEIQVVDWWPANGDYFVASLMPEEPYGCHQYCGTPALVSYDGQRIEPFFEVSIENVLSTRVAGDRGGEQVAFALNGRGFIYSLVDGLTEIDPVRYGLRAGSFFHMPSWAPDGRQLAWVVYEPANEDHEEIAGGILILNLATTEAQYFTNYLVGGWDGFVIPPSWSADSQKVAFQAVASVAFNYGSYLIDLELDEVELLGTGYYPRILGDTGWILVQDYSLNPALLVAISMNDGQRLKISHVSQDLNPIALNPWYSDRFLTVGAAGQMWEVDMSALTLTLTGVPAGSRPLAWVEVLQ